MSITKKIIIDNISKNIKVSKNISADLFIRFLSLITLNSKKSDVKINNFGTFRLKKTPIREGRNPKTKESYIINPSIKLTLSVSNKIKKNLN